MGEIISIEEYPSQSMATLWVKEQTILIPIHPDWIIDLNPESKELTLDLPEGLIDSQLD
ncbi:MAG: 16S rRNA processing protein RimM [Sphingobacteriales bacterium]